MKIWKLVYFGFCTFVILFLIFPIFIILPISFSSARYLTFPPPGFSLQWYINFFNRPDWMMAIWLSTKIAVIVMCIATPLGTLAALGIDRGKFIGRNFLYAFFVSPLIMPLVSVALASYFLLAKFKLIGTQIGLALVHSVIALPIVIIIVLNTLKNFNTDLEKASMVLGANRIRTFFKITFPLIKTGILSAAFFAFLASFDELIIALFVGGTKVVTLPRRMWQGLRMEIDPTIAAVATILVTISVVILGAIMLLQKISEKKLKN